MPVAESTIALGALAVGALGLGAWYLLAPAGVSVADQEKTAADVGYKSGYARGEADAKAGKLPLVDPAADETAIAESKKSLAPKIYLKAWVKGYGEGYASVLIPKKETKKETGGGGTTTTTPWKPPGPPSGLPDAMREGESAYDYGCRRGSAKGKEDGDAGNESDPDSPLTEAKSLKRQAESGDPSRYQAGYRACYKTAWVAASTAYELAKALKKSESSDSFFEGSTFGEIVMGEDAVGERQLFARRPAYRPAFLRAA